MGHGLCPWGSIELLGSIVLNKSSSIPNTIAEIFSRTMREHPDNPALITPQWTWTYFQLGQLVRSGMDLLQSYLATPECRMAIVGNNHPAYVVGYFASQCLGKPTVEVRPLEKLDRQLEIIERTNAAFVLTDVPALENTLKGRVPAMSFAAFLQSCQEAVEKGDLRFENITWPGTALSEASIIYTSGTTGSPKGVILTQGNFCFIVNAVVDYLRLTAKDRYALILPLNHTYGKTVLLTSIRVGASIVMLDNFNRVQEFVKALSENQCTIFSGVPYHIHVILKWCNLSSYDLSSLRILTFSANKLPSSTIDQLTKVLPHAKIFSMYGLTESTTRVCFVPPDVLMRKKESCGRPLRGVEVKIIDQHGNPLPPEKSGEVVLRGPNVMKGYFGDPELTSATLIDGWLRTGDLGYLDEEGFLYLVGREKEIIKCAGERISPAEIEEVLLCHPKVAEAAVTGSPDSTLGEIVHAFIVPKGNSLEEGELKTYCAKLLSHHKLPRRYTFVEELPKTPTGKVKKHLLKSP